MTTVIGDGQRAQRLLADELLTRTLSEMKQATIDNWVQLRPDQSESLMRCKLYMEAISLFESSLTARVQAMEKQMYDESLKRKE